MNYKIISIVIILIAGTSVCHAEEPTDTVKVIENASNVLVVAKDGKTVLDAEFQGKNDDETLHYQYEVNVMDADTIQTEDEFPDNWGMDLPFVKNKDMNVKDNHVRRYISCVRRIYWGWRFNYGGKGNVRNGWELSIPDFLALTWRRRGAEFELGVGFSGSHYNAQDNFFYQKQGDKLILASVEEGLKVKETSLDIFTIQVPMLYNQRISKDFTFSIGAIANFNTYAVATTKKKNFDEEYHKITYKGLQQNLFTVDAYASISVCNIGVFAKWSPMKVFKQQFGPDLKGFTIGVELSFSDLFSF